MGGGGGVGGGWWWWMGVCWDYIISIWRCASCVKYGSVVENPLMV